MFWFMLRKDITDACEWASERAHAWMPTDSHTVDKYETGEKTEAAVNHIDTKSIYPKQRLLIYFQQKPLFVGSKL